MKLEEIFLVSQINEYAILGMPILTRHDCKVDFDRPIVTIEERELVRTGWLEWLMVSHVQTIRRTTIPQQTSVLLICHLASHSHTPEELIESLSDQQH